MKRIVSVALVLALLVLLGAGCSRNSNGQLWQLLEKEDYNLFINYVDGYELRLDKGYQVDMSMAEVVTVLEKEDTRIEIYRQTLGDFSAQTYLGYSNHFLDNTVDHVLDYEKTTISFGRRVYLKGWHREKLSRVDGDQNYYFEMDIVKHRAVYTILIKSAAPITEPEAYIGWLAHFKTFHTDAEAPAWTTQAVDARSRGWDTETRALYESMFLTDDSLRWGISSTTRKPAARETEILLH